MISPPADSSILTAWLQRIGQTTDELEKTNLIVELLQKHTPSSDLLPDLAEELQRHAVSFHNPLLRARVLHEIGMTLSEKGLCTLSLPYCLQTYELYAGNPERQGSTALLIGKNYMFLGDYSSSLHYFYLALKNQDFLRKGEDVGVLINLGAVYHTIEDYENALIYYSQALTLLEKRQDIPFMLYALLGNMGELYMRMGKPEQASEYMIRSLSLPEEHQYLEIRTASLLNLSVLHTRQQDFNKAEEYWRAGLTKILEMQDLVSLATAYRAGAFLYEQRGQLDKALTYAHQALTLGEEHTIHIEMEAIYEILGIIYTRMKRYEDALRYLLLGFEYVRQNNNGMVSHTLYSCLSALYEAQDNYEEALRSYKLSVESARQHNDRMTLHRLNAMQVRHEVHLIQQENQVLHIKNQQLEQQLELQTRELTTQALSLVEKRTLLDALDKKIHRIREESRDEHTRRLLKNLLKELGQTKTMEGEWSFFEERFRQIYPGFMNALITRHPAISPTEARICALLRINLTSKEIASLLSLSSRTVDNHRYNIRKKLCSDDIGHLHSYLITLK